MEARNTKNLRIIRVLLSSPKGTLTKYRIARIADCSTAWAIEFLQNLEKKRLVKKTKVLDFERLVDYYIEIAPKLKYFDFYVKDPISLLKQSKLYYALTTYGAENLTSHHLFPSRYDVYVKEEDLDKWKSLIIKSGLLGKGNFRIIVVNDAKILKEATILKRVKVASMPQLLIDLKKEGGVCLEAYKLLVKEDV